MGEQSTKKYSSKRESYKKKERHTCLRENLLEKEYINALA